MERHEALTPNHQPAQAEIICWLARLDTALPAQLYKRWKVANYSSTDELESLRGSDRW